MHQVVLLLLLLLLFWFMIPTSTSTTARPSVLLPGAEPYENEPSRIQFTNAEFKFYK
jgi:hypothetical protein